MALIWYCGGMVTARKEPSKQAARELARWAAVLRLREAGLGIEELAHKYDLTRAQIYHLLKRARDARAQGWIDGQSQHP